MVDYMGVYPANLGVRAGSLSIDRYASRKLDGGTMCFLKKLRIGRSLKTFEPLLQQIESKLTDLHDIYRRNKPSHRLE